MSDTKPFFQHIQHATGLRSPAPIPVRYPYHDQEECPAGQELKETGDWQYYEPQTREETRTRCLHCMALTRAASSSSKSK